MLEGMFAIGGVTLAVWLDFGFFFLKNDSANWRFPIAFQAVFAIGIASLIFMLPGKFDINTKKPSCVNQRQNHLDGMLRKKSTKMHSDRYLDLTVCQRIRPCFDKKWKSSGMLSHKNLSELLAILLREHLIAI